MPENQAISKYSLFSTANSPSWFTIQGYYNEHFSQYSMKRHLHRRIEIMYAVSGSFIAEILVNNRWKNVCVRSGEFIIIDAEVPHSLYLPENYEARIMNLELEVAHDFSSSFNMARLRQVCKNVSYMLSYRSPYIKLMDNNGIQKIIQAIQQEMQFNEEKKDVPESIYMQNLLLAQFWISVSRCYGERLSNKPLYLYVKKAIEYIETYYTNDISVEDISEYAGVHSSYLQKIFKASIGCSVLNYVNRVRINRACFLLSQTELPIQKIGEEVGYKSRQNFIHVFKSIRGITPSDYRKSIQNMALRCYYQDPLTNQVIEEV